MTEETPLPSLDDVSNVYIFLADALRWSALPDSVQSLGATFKTVASGCGTVRAVPSILTGFNPPHHGVASWTDQLTEQTILDLEGWNSGYYNPAGGKKGGLNVVLNRESEEALSDIDPPFVYFERDQGGHAPYRGLSYQEMLETLDHAPSSLRQYYTEMVDKSTARFEERLRTLEERGLIDDTLVIFLSDHGELLGEHGLVSHSSPPAPELVYVPTVFIHPELSGGRRPETIRHVDLVPTILSALQRETAAQSLDGVNLCEETPGPGYNDAKYDVKFRGRNINIYHSCGLWDGDGGHVFTTRGKPLSPLIGWKRAKGWNRQYWKQNPGDLLRGLSCLSAPSRTYGVPGFSQKVAREQVSEVQDVENLVRTVTLDAEVEEQLNDLGYR